MSPRASRRREPPPEQLTAPRWSRAGLRPRRAGRWAVVGVLLALAAGVLYAGETVPPHREPAGPPASATGGPDPRPRCAPPADSPPAGLVGFPLRLTDPAPLAVVHAGHHIDVLAGRDPGSAADEGPGDSPRPSRVATDVTVLRTVRSADELSGVLYLAVTDAQATALARLTDRTSVSVTVRAPN